MRHPTTDDLKAAHTFRLVDYIAWAESRINNGDWKNRRGLQHLIDVHDTIGHIRASHEFPLSVVNTGRLRSAIFKTCHWKHHPNKYPVLYDLADTLVRAYMDLEDDDYNPNVTTPATQSAASSQEPQGLNDLMKDHLGGF